MVSLVQINNTAPARTAVRAHAVLAPRTLDARLDSSVNFARTSSPLTLAFRVQVPRSETKPFWIVLVLVLIHHNFSRHGHFLVQCTRQIVPELAFAANDKHLGQRFDLRRRGCGSRSRSADRRGDGHCRSPWCGAGAEERSRPRSGVVVVRRAEGSFGRVVEAGSADGEGVAVVGTGPCAGWTGC